MTGAQALSLLMSRLGSRTDAALRATLLLEMQAKQTELEGMAFLPWFLKGDDTTISTTIAQEYATLPATFLRFDDDWGGCYYLDTTATSPDQWVPLRRDPYANIKERFRDGSQASPQAFDILASRIYIRPIPDAVYSLRFVGYFADTAVADDATTNLWLTHASDLLLAETGYRVASLQMQHMELAAVFAQDVQKAKTRLLVEHHARAMSAQSVQMGDD